ncbi:hypothetical protein WI75_25515 [Burkholderia ubonensis]|nr:hypothetical protein WI75_25515 [Burkholderia ubonensis]
MIFQRPNQSECTRNHGNLDIWVIAMIQSNRRPRHSLICNAVLELPAGKVPRFVLKFPFTSRHARIFFYDIFDHILRDHTTISLEDRIDIIFIDFGHGVIYGHEALCTPPLMKAVLKLKGLERCTRITYEPFKIRLDRT